MLEKMPNELSEGFKLSRSKPMRLFEIQKLAHNRVSERRNCFNYMILEVSAPGMGTQYLPGSVG